MGDPHHQSIGFILIYEVLTNRIKIVFGCEVFTDCLTESSKKKLVVFFETVNGIYYNLI